MRKIVKWLCSIEQLASEFYGDAAVIFEEDKGLANFLTSLAEDEDLHLHIMRLAAETLEEETHTIPAHISLDSNRKDRIKGSQKDKRTLL